MQRSFGRTSERGLMEIPTCWYAQRRRSWKGNGEKRYDSTWEPRALLNGAGAFGLKVQDRILALWKAQQRM